MEQLVRGYEDYGCFVEQVNSMFSLVINEGNSLYVFR